MRPRRLGTVLVLAVTWLELVACSGKSDDAKSRSTTAGGTSGGAGNGAGGSAGRPPGCEYNGVRYELGESFGACDACSCTKTGGVFCDGCPGAGGAPNGGSAGTLPDAGAGNALEAGKPPFAGAGSGTAGLAGTSAGAGMSAGAGPSAGSGGDISSGGMPGTVREDCGLRESQLCIVGTPRGGGHELTVGMPMLFTLQAGGCLSSSCTELVSADCNYIGSPHDFYVNGFFCVNVTEGAACTDDCGGAPTMNCDLNQTLEEGDYVVQLGNSAFRPLRFTVPGVIAEEDRCTHSLAE